MIPGIVTPQTNPNVLMNNNTAEAEATLDSGNEARTAGSKVDTVIPSAEVMISKNAQATLGVLRLRVVKSPKPKAESINIAAWIGRYTPNLLSVIPPIGANIKMPIVMGMKLTPDVKMAVPRTAWK
jgi:hypothetical protein